MVEYLLGVATSLLMTVTGFYVNRWLSRPRLAIRGYHIGVRGWGPMGAECLMHVEIENKGNSDVWITSLNFEPQGPDEYVDTLEVSDLSMENLMMVSPRGNPEHKRDERYEGQALPIKIRPREVIGTYTFWVGMDHRIKDKLTEAGYSGHAWGTIVANASNRKRYSSQVIGIPLTQVPGRGGLVE